jgi:hypothetical protein
MRRETNTRRGNFCHPRGRLWRTADLIMAIREHHRHESITVVGERLALETYQISCVRLLLIDTTARKIESFHQAQPWTVHLAA